jgi:hypothetical protein
LQSCSATSLICCLGVRSCTQTAERHLSPLQLRATTQLSLSAQAALLKVFKLSLVDLGGDSD